MVSLLEPIQIAEHSLPVDNLFQFKRNLTTASQHTFFFFCELIGSGADS